jgi:hypothetical protein
VLPIPSHARIDLGVLPKGKDRDVKFWLVTAEKADLRVQKVATSCDCVSVDLDNYTVQEGHKVGATVKLRFADDPTFSGSLLLEATAYCVDGSIAFVIYIT